MNNPAYYELYRRTTIGIALTDALDNLILDQRIQPQLAIAVLSIFDKVISDQLKETIKSKLNFKGHLSIYNFCDDVWTFQIKDLDIKLDNNETLSVDKLRIVACSSKRAGE
ncbi:transcription initiation factor IIA subunit gamma [Ascoidea rubescens DSM 1968]|uniref:Transcription initiation factor IIA subunit 2 n=1 Tax=Ascoidea rubescens DSM 1968 TaxID=1344418 RepID=A0A1D2VFG6_9ASCO|nr:transcription initiation factor IIA small subunit [Ascoidea rubescens DSM 1968]ODV60260.1 transcription initiation factor IIA small subunit [Ascoidea rubescens DSM 1968]